MTADELRVVFYPHPALRHRSKPLRRVDAELRRMIGRMFELLYEKNGVGLAANQVALPYRLFILNLTGDQSAKDEELVFINPVITNRHGQQEDDEGCLSFPGIWAKVQRPERVVVQAYNLKGEQVRYEMKGLGARAVMHENDHLDGVLFIDRVAEDERQRIAQELAKLEQLFAHQQQKGEIASAEEIRIQLLELEKART